MNWETYLNMSEMTLSTNFHIESEHERNMLHAAMGLCTEAGELLELNDVLSKGGQHDVVNLKEELGDAWWYVAIIHREVLTLKETEESADVSFNIDLMSSIRQLNIKCLHLLDMMKKYAFYGKRPDERPLSDLMQEIEYILYQIGGIHGFTLADIRETNIRKLKARYGDKFTEEAAVNRDLDTERKTLES